MEKLKIDIPNITSQRTGRFTAWAAWISLQLVFLVSLFLLPSPIFPIGITLTLFFGLAILFEPFMSLVGVAVITFLIHSQVIGKEFYINLLGVNWYAMDWILLFAVLTWLMRRGGEGQSAKIQSSLTLTLIVFLLYLPVSAYVGIQQGNAFRDSFADLRKFSYYLAFFLVMVFVDRPKHLEQLFWVVVSCGMLGALPEIFESLSASQIDSLTGQQLAFGRITGANEVNYPLLLVGSAAFFPFAQGVGKRIVLILSITISSIAMFLSYTRGSWLAAVAGLVVLFLLLLIFAPRIGRDVGKFVIAMLAIAAVILLLDLGGISPLQVIQSRSALVSSSTIDISSLGRLVEWQNALTAFSRHPILGAGLGHIYTFFAPGIGHVSRIYVHNSYLYVLSKMGLFGLFLFIGLFGTALVAFYRGLKRLGPGTEMGLMLVFGSMLVVLLVKSLTTWHLNTLEGSMFVGVVLGSIARVESWSKHPNVDPAGSMETASFRQEK